MTVDQEWSSVYPTATSFKLSTVPLSIHMGYPVKRRGSPEKKGNLELMKVVLLNLITVLNSQITIVKVHKHIKLFFPMLFCTKWPETLDSEQHLPIQVTMTDFLSAGPSVRNPKESLLSL
ncbi:RT35 protein, partial [Polyodon spathula]|nr:RT35 protein [Polyodon spathula]